VTVLLTVDFIVFADGAELSTAKYQQFDKSVLGLFPYTMQQLNTGLQAYQFGRADIPDYIIGKNNKVCNMLMQFRQ
jgi:hypothetical protein